MICKHILLITLLNELKLILLLTVRCFHILLSITNNSIKHQSFVYSQLNDQTVQFSISYLFGLVWFVGFYGISTFVGYLTPNPFLCK